MHSRHSPNFFFGVQRRQHKPSSIGQFRSLSFPFTDTDTHTDTVTRARTPASVLATWIPKNFPPTEMRWDTDKLVVSNNVCTVWGTTQRTDEPARGWSVQYGCTYVCMYLCVYITYMYTSIISAYINEFCITIESSDGWQVVWVATRQMKRRCGSGYTRRPSGCWMNGYDRGCRPGVPSWWAYKRKICYSTVEEKQNGWSVGSGDNIGTQTRNKNKKKTTAFASTVCCFVSYWWCEVAKAQ